MALRNLKVEPFDLVVFGGTGDLAYRKLFPALLHRERSEQFSEPTRIVGVSRRHLDRNAFRTSVKDALVKFKAVEREAGAAMERFLGRLDYVSADITSDSGWSELHSLLGPDERIRAFYLATGPDLVLPSGKAPRRRGTDDAPVANHRGEANRNEWVQRRGDQRRTRFGFS